MNTTPPQSPREADRLCSSGRSAPGRPPGPHEDTADVQSLNVTPSALYEVLDEWDAAGRPQETREPYLHMVVAYIGQLRSAGHEVDLRGRRPILDQLIYGFRSRSGNFEIHRAGHVFDAAYELGLIRDGREWRDARDVETGKPVMTRLREVARLKYDWTSEKTREWLRDSWPQIVSMKMVDLKYWVREHNADSTAWMTQPTLADVLVSAVERHGRLYGANTVTADTIIDALDVVERRLCSRGPGGAP